VKKLKRAAAAAIDTAAKAARAALREDVLVTAGFLGGLAAMAIAVGLVFAPAGLFVGGLFATAGSGLYARTRARAGQ
jgi:hypothetical protein